MNRRKFIEGASATAIGAAVAANSSAAQTAKSKAKAKSAKRKVITDRAPKPAGPYSQAIVAGNTVYVAG